MRKYKHIFFDLDNTLWNFSSNSNKVQREMYDLFGLDEFFRSADQFVDIYHGYNDELWTEYRRGTIKKEKLKWYRFYLTLKDRFVEDEKLARKLDDHYLAESPMQTGLIRGAKEMLENLGSAYSLHIITNGFNEVQNIKLENSGLSRYFSTVVTSEEAGVMKPDPGIFEYALKKAGALKEDSIMVGDILEVDILGAKKAGIDQIFLSPNGYSHNHDITYQVRSLAEIADIL